MVVTDKEFIAAVTKGEQAEVERMLTACPELVSSTNETGVSAILLAVYYGLPDMAKLLISHCVQLNIFEASATGMTGLVKDLLVSDPPLVNAYAPDGFQPLGLAAFFGHIDVARLLLENGAEVNSPSHNGQRVMPLHSAAAGQHLEIARLLLSYGADPNAVQAENFTPLHSAADNGQVELIRLMLSSGADPNIKMMGGQTPYDLAVSRGHTEAAELLRPG